MTRTSTSDYCIKADPKTTSPCTSPMANSPLVATLSKKYCTCTSYYSNEIGLLVFFYNIKLQGTFCWYNKWYARRKEKNDKTVQSISECFFCCPCINIYTVSMSDDQKLNCLLLMHGNEIASAFYVIWKIEEDKQVAPFQIWSWS